MTSNINQDIQKYLDYLATVGNVDFDIDVAAITREGETAKEYLVTSVLNNVLAQGKYSLDASATFDLFASRLVGGDELDLFFTDTYSTAVVINENWIDGDYVIPLSGDTVDEFISLLENATSPPPPIIANAGTPLSELLVRDLKTIYDFFDSFSPAEWAQVDQLSQSQQTDWWHDTPERERIYLTFNAFKKFGAANPQWTFLSPPRSASTIAITKQNFLLDLEVPGAITYASPKDLVHLDTGPVPTDGSIKTSLTDEEMREGIAKVISFKFNEFLQNSTTTDFTSPEEFFNEWVDYFQANPHLSSNFTFPSVTSYIASPLAGTTMVDVDGLQDARLSAPVTTLNLFEFANQTEEDDFKATFSSAVVGLLLPDFVESMRVVDDWADLKLSDAQIATLFQQTLLGYVNYLSSGTAPVTEDFFTGWGNFIGPYMLLGAGPGEDPETAMLRTFEDIWTVFMGPERREDFLGKLSGLINQTIADDKPFIPGMLTDEWFQNVSALFFKENCIIDPTSSVKEADFEFVDLLLRIYDLLVEMLGFLQNMAAAQVSRENFLAKYEGAYTDYITQIPTYTSADPNLGEDSGGSNSTKRELRQDLAGLSTKYTENLKGFRSGVEDLGKQQRTQVTQTNEAVSQQANIATTILQQFSSLLQSIWR